ncbi:glycoside hydrolase family 6 protein [Luteimicrobium sp. NPDC057192]|uniref:glycoside hydrolase family 6 protein n=1 Tax=Luteimicrobium sp. NPDC057192 TaxID=3346042 RepID=UPI00362FF4FF
MTNGTLQSTTPHLQRPRRRGRRPAVTASALAVALAVVGLTAVPATAAPHHPAPSPTTPWVDPDSTTVQAARTLSGQARDDAVLLGSYASATWITSGTPTEAKAEAQRVTTSAADDGAVPTIVVYDIPYRDCAQYSAGGAQDTAAYDAFVDGVAAGIGDRPAIVILEPDGLGIIPWNTDLGGNAEWCQPADVDRATAVADRYAQLNHAVDALKGGDRTRVYLDGTHSGWLGAGDIADRLIKAGVERADGFFLNASNYESTDHLVKYGTWISDCIELSTQSSWYQPSYCGSQYYPASPGDFSTWALTDQKYADDFASTGLTPDPAHQAHFVIDTSRNGVGPWTPPAGNGWPDAQVWCNPPDRGAGARPTLDPGVPLVDAYLWIKVPGESDGQCDRGTGDTDAAGRSTDPARGGNADPAAGAWFAQQARELVALASPPFPTPTCQVTYRATKVTPHTWAGAVTVRNSGTSTVRGWELTWSYTDGQRAVLGIGARVHQSGDDVTASAPRGAHALRPGATASFALAGTASTPPGDQPMLFRLDGKACSVR